MLICKSCRDVFDSEMLIKHHECPKLDCSGKLIDIDDALVPTIRKLWEKGIVTKSCCSGHPISNDDEGDCFIVFDLSKSGIAIHEALKESVEMGEFINQAYYPLIEYMPATNNYTIRMHHLNYPEWLRSLSFFDILARKVSQDFVTSTSVYDYFFTEWCANNVTDLCIGTMVGGDYWRIYHNYAKATFGNLDSHGNELPADAFGHCWDPSMEEFKGASTFKNMEEFKKSLHDYTTKLVACSN